MAEVPCAFPDCTEDAQRYGLCWGHAKQKQRGRPLTPLREVLNPKEAVLAAAVDWVEVDSEDDDAYQRAEQAVLARAESWLRSRGWRPPAPHRQRQVVLMVVQLTLPLRPPRGVHARAYARA